MRILISAAILLVYDKKGAEHERSTLVCASCPDGRLNEPALPALGHLRRRRRAKDAGSVPRRGSDPDTRRLRRSAACRFHEGAEVVAALKGPLGARVDVVGESEPQSTPTGGRERRRWTLLLKRSKP